MMLKIITLAVVVFAVILLHGASGRSLADDVTTTRPKLIRVPLRRYDPLVDGSQTLDVAPVSRPKRQIDDVFDDLKRGPLASEVSEESNESSSKELKDSKGFEGLEQEEKLAENENDVDSQGVEATEGKLMTDDEKQRFDVENGSSSTKNPVSLDDNL